MLFGLRDLIQEALGVHRNLCGSSEDLTGDRVLKLRLSNFQQGDEAVLGAGDAGQHGVDVLALGGLIGAARCQECAMRRSHFGPLHYA